VRIVRSSANEGLCASRVKLLDLCRTKLAVFLDADDLIESSFIEKTLRAYNHSPLLPNAITSWRQNFGASTEKVLRYNWEDHSLFLANDLRMTGLIEIGALKSVGFQSSMRNGEADDWDFWLRFKQNGYRLVCVPEPLFKYRFAPGTMSWPWSEGQAALTAQLIGKQLFHAIQTGQLSEAVLIDLVVKATWQQEQIWGGESELLSARRVAYVSKIKSTHPVTYNVIRSIMRISTSVAKHRFKQKNRRQKAGAKLN
jgi:glycosyltransferase involved in cell wall biosynthesis